MRVSFREENLSGTDAEDEDLVAEKSAAMGESSVRDQGEKVLRFPCVSLL